MKVWILFSVANDYNQPARAFEKLWWSEPTNEEIATQLGYSVDYVASVRNRLFNGGLDVPMEASYWIDVISK